MKSLLLVVLFSVISDAAIGYSSNNCSELTMDLYKAVKDLIETYVSPQYQQLNCLATAFFGVTTDCDFSNIVPLIRTPNCDLLRQEMAKNKRMRGEAVNKVLNLQTAQEDTITSMYTYLDKDAQPPCENLQKFNKLNKTQRVYEDYAKIYDSSIKYWIYAYNWIIAKPYDVYSKDLHNSRILSLSIRSAPKPKPAKLRNIYGSQCLYDIDMVGVNFFNLTFPYDPEDIHIYFTTVF